VSPASGTAARSQFASDADSDPDQDQEQEANEEESPEEEEGNGEAEEGEEEATPQPQPLPPPLSQPAGGEEEPTGGQVEEVEDYNAWRDNFYDLNEDGSYVYG